MPEKVEITTSSVLRLLHPMHTVLAREKAKMIFHLGGKEFATLESEVSRPTSL
jgi:hypothetical protein